MKKQKNHKPVIVINVRTLVNNITIHPPIKGKINIEESLNAYNERGKRMVGLCNEALLSALRDNEIPSAENGASRTQESYMKDGWMPRHFYPSQAKSEKKEPQPLSDEQKTEAAKYDIKTSDLVKKFGDSVKAST